ncbi:MAG: hypothetical protein Q4B63_05865 [Clostridium perfringens]|nr:hypothetical protein [Clostridium perfringens]
MNSDKKYTLILLTTTLISVGIMICFNNTSSHYEFGYNFEDEDNKDSVENKELIISHEENIEDKSVQDIEKDLNDNSKKDEVGEVIEGILDSNSTKYNKKVEGKVQDSYDNNDNNIGSLEDDKSITVFKVDKNNIINEISNKDKLKLIKMANNLSISDYKELLEHVKRSDELLAAIDIFKLLKEKLSINDYERLTEILLPFIDINTIENKINEK